MWWLQDTTGIDELDEDDSCRGPGVFGECGCIWARAANSAHCVTFRSLLRCLIGRDASALSGDPRGADRSEAFISILIAFNPWDLWTVDF